MGENINTRAKEVISKINEIKLSRVVPMEVNNNSLQKITSKVKSYNRNIIIENILYTDELRSKPEFLLSQDDVNFLLDNIENLELDVDVDVFNELKKYLNKNAIRSGDKWTFKNTD